MDKASTIPRSQQFSHPEGFCWQFSSSEADMVDSQGTLFRMPPDVLYGRRSFFMKGRK
jgi:hypothetical protein